MGSQILFYQKLLLEYFLVGILTVVLMSPLLPQPPKSHQQNGSVGLVLLLCGCFRLVLSYMLLMLYVIQSYTIVMEALSVLLFARLLIRGQHCLQVEGDTRAGEGPSFQKMRIAYQIFAAR